jgi:tRNA(Ile)-lysidine synthase
VNSNTPRSTKSAAELAIEAAVDAAIKRCQGESTNPVRICVAYSGGVDSTVLLHALAAQTFRNRVVLSAHQVHHGLSPNADVWAAHCQASCDLLGVPLMVSRVEVDRHSKQGIEAAAREARYIALRDHAVEKHHVIALAHHRRDQAETLLLQLFRGTGPEGLAAMPSADAALVRPLLAVSKAAIDDYAAQFALQHIEDESNADTRFTRNRLRSEVWPQLAAAFPSAEHTLARASLLQAEAAALINELALIDAANCIHGGELALVPWRALSSARRRNLLRYWLDHAQVRALSFATLCEWEMQLCSQRAEQNIALRVPVSEANPDTFVRVFRGDAVLVRKPSEIAAIPWHGESTLPFGDDEIRFVDDKQYDSALRIRKPRSNERWVLRQRQSGDRIKLSANSGHVALKNIMQNANIAPWLRDTWPILVCNGEIVVLPELCVNNSFTPANDESGVIPRWQRSFL